MEVVLVGGAAQAMRAAVRAVTPDKKKEMMRQVARRFAPGSDLKDFALSDDNEKSGPYRMKFTFAAPEFATASGAILLPPAAPSVSGSENPFENETRVFPVVQNDTSRTRSETIITPPPGYALASVPAEVRLSCAFETYRNSVTVSPDGKVTITEILETVPARVPVGEYHALQAFYKNLAKAGRGKLVFQSK